MNDSFGMDDETNAGFQANTSADDTLDLQGEYHVECEDEDGNVKWEETISNIVVNAGLDHALAVTLSGATQSSSWYLGLVDGATAPTFAAGDTMASHSGWSVNTDYSETARQVWSEGGVSAQSLDNSGSVATFSVNATSDIAGAFLVDDSTKGGTAGTLFAGGAFSATRTVASGDTLNVTYTLNAA